MALLRLTNCTIQLWLVWWRSYKSVVTFLEQMSNSLVRPNTLETHKHLALVEPPSERQRMPFYFLYYILSSHPVNHLFGITTLESVSPYRLTQVVANHSWVDLNLDQRMLSPLTLAWSYCQLRNGRFRSHDSWIVHSLADSTIAPKWGGITFSDLDIPQPAQLCWCQW